MIITSSAILNTKISTNPNRATYSATTSTNEQPKQIFHKYFVRLWDYSGNSRFPIIHYDSDVEVRVRVKCELLCKFYPDLVSSSES